ncbi:MAG TPA: DUF4190 domain-containing protein [Anaerohalosphaeraceae bacterium]|nr:DUF4190 domain-containing protein [Anaerohalosphaeraceae bacterium]
MVLVGCYGILEMLIDAFIWGTTMYLMYLLISGNDKKWVLGGIISSLIYFLHDTVIGSLIIGYAGIEITNQQIIENIGHNFSAIEYSDFIFDFGLSFGGFVLGRILTKKAVKKGLINNNSNIDSFTNISLQAINSQRVDDIIQSKGVNMTGQEQGEKVKKKKGLATTSLVCGICALAYPTSILFFASIAGIIFGHVAKYKIKNEPELYCGKGRADTGLVLSYIALVLGLILGGILTYLHTSIKSTLS